MKVQLTIPSAEVAKIATKFGIPIPVAVPFSVTLTLNVTEPNVHGSGDPDIVSAAIIGVQ
jgi:hypothetical protein